MDGSADFKLILTVNESATNSGANTSDVSYSLVIDPPGNWEAWNLTSSNQSYTVTINGSVVASGGFTYDFRGSLANVNKTIKSGSVTGIAHNTDGSKTITASATANTTNSAIGDGVVSSFNIVLTDFARVPAAPAAPSFTRTDPAVIGVTSAVPSSAMTITNYSLRWSTNNSTWSTDVTMGSDGVYDFTATATQGYWFQTRAYSSEGWGSYGVSGFIAGVPTAPTAISLVRTSRNVTVNISPSASNGGATISSYTVEYNDGTGWGNAQNITSGSYTYTNLPAGKTYQFRTYATNSTGSSSYTSDSIFVPAGGKRWDGTSFVSTSTAKRWDGSAWVDILTAKRWDGSAWSDLS
jgi:hypothetical protein